jgi:hypothetical protein
LGGRWQLGIEQIGQSTDRLDFNVTRCQYAEFYKELSLAEFGYLFHCNRDFAMAEGFSSTPHLEAHADIMEGASHCDFRFPRSR